MLDLSDFARTYTEARGAAAGPNVVPLDADGDEQRPRWNRTCVRISGFEQWTIGGDGLIAASLGFYDETEWDRQINGGPGS